jgi:opacity protein-like surface antigen
MRWMWAVLLFFIATNAVAQCYFTLGGGQSTINTFTSRDIERELFDTEYTTGVSREDRTSTVGELGVGCILSERYGVRAEISHFDGFKHVVDTQVRASFEGFTEDFEVTRIIRARGYLLSGVWEYPVSNEYLIFGRVGAAYVHATGTITAFDSPLALQASKSDFVPVVGIGLQREIDNEWAISVEHRAVGHYDVTHTLMSVQYYFN